LIVWVDGPFGSGKTTLTAQLRERWADAMEFDPEYVGYLLQRSVPPVDDFQDLASWRALTAAFLVELRREFGRPVIVPMTLWHRPYRDEIFGLVTAAGERIAHVFLDVPAGELRRRIEAQVLIPDDAAADAEARAFRLDHIARGLAARDTLPADTLVLDAGTLAPPELADAVIDRLHRP
jgi:predicted kinase